MYLIETNKPLTFLEIEEDTSIFGVIAEVTEYHNIPLVPIKVDGKIIYPVGTKICFLFREEIEFLLNRNCKVKVLQLGFCSGWAPIFKDFIGLVYEERKKNKGNFYYYLLKIFMNSLYGKFAETEIKDDYKLISYEQFMKIDEDNVNAEIVIVNSQYYVFVRTEQRIKLKTNIIFAMRITALCRLELLKAILKDKCAYSDSDSLVTENIIQDSLELGELKAEFIFDKFQALSCKEYIYEIEGKNVCKMKGFGKQIFENFDDFAINYFMPKKNWRVAGFFEVLRSQNHGNKLNFGEIIVYDKFKRSVYDKRVILDDLTTRPIDFSKETMLDVQEHNAEKIRQIIYNYKQNY